MRTWVYVDIFGRLHSYNREVDFEAVGLTFVGHSWLVLKDEQGNELPIVVNP